ncbi:MAG: ROK family protein [Elusimicrobiota bacterium]
MKKKVLAVDIGGTNTLLGLMDEEYNLINIDKKDTPFSGEELKAYLKKYLQKIDPEEIVEIGVALPAFLKKESEKQINIPNLDLKNLGLASFFSKLDQKFYTVNDGTAAAWGSYITEVEDDTDKLLVMTLGTGVGGGIVINGDLFTEAGEIGHLKIDPAGKTCGCGSRGCLETFIGGEYIPENAREWFDVEVKSSRELFEKAERGNSRAKKCWEKIGRILGFSLSGLVNVFGFQKIILGGEITRAGKYFVSEVKRELRYNLMNLYSQECELKISKWKEKLTLIGTAALAFSGNEKLRR